jgi:beta-lactamase class D
MFLRQAALSLMAVGLAASPVQARIICTTIADAGTGKFLVQQGNWRECVTPAPTFKIAISLMGYDSDSLKDSHSPALPFREGYPDWGGPGWHQPTDPTRWIKYSVVWFSQQVTQSLGQARFQTRVDEFQYGNKAVSEDPGKNNGLLRSWVDSSLKNFSFGGGCLLKESGYRQLPVTPHAFDMTSRVTQITKFPNGWDIHGKTGTGFPPMPNGSDDKAHGNGWFVGWATKKPQTLVLAHLVQDEKEEPGAAGYASAPRC